MTPEAWIAAHESAIGLHAADRYRLLACWRASTWIHPTLDGSEIVRRRMDTGIKVAASKRGPVWSSHCRPIRWRTSRPLETCMALDDLRALPIGRGQAWPGRLGAQRLAIETSPRVTADLKQPVRANAR